MKTGQDLVNLAKTKIGSKYRLGILVPKDNSNYEGAFDCAEFVIWCYYQLTSKLYGCTNNKGNPHTADAYTGYIDRDAHSIGKIVTIQEANSTPGALLLRVATNGEIGHVVICEGLESKTIEAHSTLTGVIEDTTQNRRWDYGLLLPELDYSRSKITTSIFLPSTYRWTSPMMINEGVGKIQKALNSTMEYSLLIDNKFGSITYLAVKSFQKAHNLVVDGEVGIKT